jgi:hypothetical protein
VAGSQACGCGWQASKEAHLAVCGLVPAQLEPLVLPQQGLGDLQAAVENTQQTMSVVSDMLRLL